MASASKRLMIELRQSHLERLKNPSAYEFVAAPLESDIHTWHYVLFGSAKTPYEGGYYHGILKFPPEYPMKPPSVTMVTPSGRFETHTKICLSMSDFHPETWQPTWTHDKIVIGLQSFMNGTESTVGAVTTSDDVKRRYAKESLAFNCRDKNFKALFPDLVKKYEESQKEEGNRGGAGADSNGGLRGSGVDGGSRGGLSSQAKYVFIAAAIFIGLFGALKWFGGDEGPDFNQIPDF